MGRGSVRTRDFPNRIDVRRLQDDETNSSIPMAKVKSEVLVEGIQSAPFGGSENGK